jgi:hypothetical protein
VYDAPAAIAEPKLKVAPVIVPANAGVVVQLPAVWLVQLADTDVYQLPLDHCPVPVAKALPFPLKAVPAVLLTTRTIVSEVPLTATLAPVIVQLDWLLATVQLDPVVAPFRYSVTEYDAPAAIADPKLKVAPVIVPAAGVVVQLPTV